MGKAKAAAEATVLVVAERQNVEQVITHYTSVEAELAAACESLKKRVRSVIDVSEERNVEEQVWEIYQVISAARRQHKAGRLDREKADQVVQRLEQICERLKDAVSMGAAEVKQHQIAEIDEEVRKVTQAPQPQAEREQLSKRRSHLQVHCRRATSGCPRPVVNFERPRQRLEVSEETLKRAQADAQRARDAAWGAAITAGFSDEVLPPRPR
jgi:hypothetical protein